MAEWGLQALIRSENYHHQHHEDSFGSIDIKEEYDQALLFCIPDHLFDHHHQDHDHDLATTSSAMETTVDDQLNQLYKQPFYNPLISAASDHDHQIIQRLYPNSDQEVQQDQQQVIKNFTATAPNTSRIAPKPKKRKNQQKRVVVEVTAEGLSSDPWAWRKYGQKPIKGSIYPRSYYRCSSSKGCMARRQVEQSCTDSSIYILTYTADHNHPQPTRRNSLAGINRSRFKATPKSPNDAGKTVTKSKGSPFHSPTTISASSIEDEAPLQSINIKHETMFCNSFENQGHMMMPEISDEDCMVFSDDFFEGLEDLGGYTVEPSAYYSSSKPLFS